LAGGGLACWPVDYLWVLLCGLPVVSFSVLVAKAALAPAVVGLLYTEVVHRALSDSRIGRTRHYALSSVLLCLLFAPAIVCAVVFVIALGLQAVSAHRLSRQIQGLLSSGARSE
jgi:hypothetical protein